MAGTSYTLTELMAVTAAHEIADGEVVFAGTGLPMLGAMLAQRTHAPECCIVFEAGTVASAWFPNTPPITNRISRGRISANSTVSGSRRNSFSSSHVSAPSTLTIHLPA